MSHKEQLRGQRENTVINSTSKREDKQCQRVIERIIPKLKQDFDVDLVWEKKAFLSEVIRDLKSSFPDVAFGEARETSFMSPDGGITYLKRKDGRKYPILIAEVKNQGTNDIRAAEGKKKQAQGNAVERLGKNVIGFRTLMLSEGIFPFVCFGDGCDFSNDSPILDRVLTIAMFGTLNSDHTTNEGPKGIFNRGSYYFREQYWTADEMEKILFDVAKRSIYYYFSKYGDTEFISHRHSISRYSVDSEMVKQLKAAETTTYNCFNKR